MEFAAWVMENFSLDVATLNEEQLARFQSLYDEAMKAPESTTDAMDPENPESRTDAEDPNPEDPTRTAARSRATRSSRAPATDGAAASPVSEASILRAMRAENERVSRIQAMAGSGNDALAAQAIREGWTTDRFELAVLRASRSTPSGAAARAGSDDDAQVWEAALLMQMGSIPRNRLTAHFNERILNRADAREYRGFTLIECADRLIARSGLGYSGTRKQQGHMTAVREAGNRLRAAGFSSFTLSNILENAMDKVLIDAYQAVETVWQAICSVRSLNDFKIHSSYALDPTNTFKKVGPQGDLAQLGFSDRKYSLQAETYGLRFKIDFATWRNDDLGAISNRIGQVGLLGAQTVDQIVFALVMAGIGSTDLFHTSNANYLANSANYALGITGLTNAETAIRNQVTAANTPLGIELGALLVGTALVPTAGQLYTSTKLNETTTTDKGKGQDNPFVNKYKPIAAPYLNNTLLKDNNGAAISHQDAGLWMLFGTQGNNAAMHVGFLDGQQSPRINQIDNPSELVGFELEAAMHFGVGYGDPKLAFCANPNNA